MKKSVLALLLAAVPFPLLAQSGGTQTQLEALASDLRDSALLTGEQPQLLGAVLEKGPVYRLQEAHFIHRSDPACNLATS